MKKLKKELESLPWIRKPKKIKFRSWFKGIIKGFNSDGETEFTVVFKLKTIRSAQKAWIMSRLPAWQLVVNELSGANVLSIKTFFEDIVNRRVEVKMKIKGSFNAEKLDYKTGRVLGCYFEARLAKHILCHFPLVPGYSRIHFVARHNVEFSISISATTLRALNKGDVIHLQPTRNELAELVNRFNGVFVSLSPSFLGTTRKEAHMSIMFNEDTLPEKVIQLKRELDLLLNDKRLSMSIIK